MVNHKNKWRRAMVQNLEKLELADKHKDKVTAPQMDEICKYEERFLNALVLLGAEKLTNFNEIWMRYENIDVKSITGRG